MNFISAYEGDTDGGLRKYRDTDNRCVKKTILYGYRFFFMFININTYAKEGK